MITIGCVGCVLVWASQCFAYIRYFNWLRRHKNDLDQLKEEDPRTYSRYDRDNTNKRERFHSLLSPTQPAPAYIGLTMCLLTIFVFSSATWWKNDATFKKVAVAYAGVCILLLPYFLFSLSFLLSYPLALLGPGL
jgi:yeast amino acid transporter